MRWLLAFALLCRLGSAAPQSQDRQGADQEQADLDRALAEAGATPLEYLRALEKHLERYPGSPHKPELERAAVRAAIEAGDDRRIILYGERVLAREADDLQILDRVARALLASDSRETAERAQKYARRFEALVRRMQKEGPDSGMSAAEWQGEVDRGLGRALDEEALATGILGHLDEALDLARSAFAAWPNAESAREIARWYERQDKLLEAARALADAFTIPDPRATDADRARDRGRMGELYRRARGSEAGLGDLVLEAYDRNVALIHARELRLRQSDPNARLTDPMEFTLHGLNAPSLEMATLKGNVVVLDFWATWCIPCRAQHPLYQQVKQRFPSGSHVVFLSINTDEDREAVGPFLKEERWPEQVYFEDGLAPALAITTIPTTLVIDRHGRLFSRLNGFSPGRFVETLSERIRDALAN